MGVRGWGGASELCGMFRFKRRIHFLYKSARTDKSAWLFKAGSKSMRCININHIWPRRRSSSFSNPWKRVLFSPEANNSVKCECLRNSSPAGTGFYAIFPSAKHCTASFCPRCFASMAVRLNDLPLVPYSQKNDSQHGGPGFVAQLTEY